MSKIIFNGVDYAGGSGNYFNPVIYSDTERKIGVWRDNKPLYQKTWLVPKSSLNSGETTYTHNDDLHIDNLVSVEGAVGNTRPLVEYHSNSAWACSIYNIGNNAFWIYLGSSVYSNLANTSYVKVTLRYTKTTDVAGSGDYNTYGVPTVHSSTSEQVVGTSLDNKPLYEKTLTFSGINVDNNNINIGTVSNLKELYSATGTAKEGSYTYAIPEMGMRIRADGSGNITLRAMNNATWSNISGNVKIRYTKTTD